MRWPTPSTSQMSLNLPVLFYEGLTCSYPYANDRFAYFLAGGRAGHRKEALSQAGHRLRVLPPPQAHRPRTTFCTGWPRRGRGGHRRLSDLRRARSITPACRKSSAWLIRVVDSSCVVPMSRLEKREWAAYTIRPKITKLLPEYLKPVPAWTSQAQVQRAIAGIPHRRERPQICDLVASCEIDHTVPPSPSFAGGSKQARKQLDRFFNTSFSRYANERNEPSTHATSRPQPLSALRSHLVARSGARGQGIRAGTQADRRRVSGRADRPARAGVQLRTLHGRSRNRSNRCRTGREKTLEKHAGDPRNPVIHAAANGARRNLRRSLERHPARAAVARQDSRLLSNVLGQEDRRVVARRRRRRSTP